MNRRNALFTLSAAAATSLLAAAPVQRALAQTTDVKRLDGSEYRKMTLEGGSFALQTSQLALQQAVDPRVKEFAQFEINEQNAIAQILLDSFAANPPLAPLDNTHSTMLQALGTKQGRAFDAAYIDGQLVGHEELLRVQQGYLTPPVLDTNLRNTAIFARFSIMQHITVLQQIQRSLPA